MFKQEIKYGILSGVSLSLWFLLEYLLGLHTSRPEIGKYTGFFASIIPAIFLYLVIKKKVTEEEFESFSLYEGLKCALIVVIISVILATAFIYIYIHFLGSQWVERALDSQRDELLLMDLEEKDIELLGEQLWLVLNESLSFFKLFIFYPLMTILTGLIFSFIAIKKIPK